MTKFLCLGELVKTCRIQKKNFGVKNQRKMIENTTKNKTYVQNKWK